MKSEKQFNQYIQPDELKPSVTPGEILFPIKVEHVNLDKYHGDAMSFGYWFDDGPCTVVEYEHVVGALAEDTIALFDECNKIKKGARKPHHSMLDIVNSDLECDKSRSELLIRYGSEYFYKDDNGYWFQTEYYCNGEPQRVTDDSAEIYREVNQEYQRMIKSYNIKMREALNNIEHLKKTIARD